MEKRKLGHSDIEVSKICLGTMTYGRQNSEKDAHEQLDFATRNGVNFLDTAEMYAVPATQESQGLTEQYIGTWLKKNNRGEVILGTKITGPSPTFWYIREKLDFNPPSLRVALEGSLKRLQTDYVDLYQLHWPERITNRFGVRNFPNDLNDDPWEENFLEVIQGLNELIKEGKIRSYGLSNETPWGVMRFIALCDKHGLEKPVSIQNAYSLLNRTYEYGMSEVSLRENIGLLAYSPLAFGLLSGKYNNGTDTPENRLNAFGHIYPRYKKGNVKLAAKQYLEIAEKHKVPSAVLALAFVTQQNFLTSNIIGATTMDQLKQNIESANFTLTKEMIKDINEVHELMPNPAP